jgi:hypothetical protein
MSLFKASVTTRIRTHCEGCGITLELELVTEPIVFDNEKLLFQQVQQSARELVKHKNDCPNCKKLMRHISRWDQRGLSR